MQFVAARMSMIGGNVLSAFDFEIDPIERTASLFAHKSCGGPSVVWPHQDLAIIPFSSRDKPRILLDVVLDGQKVRAVIETGSTQSILAGPVARNRFDLVMGEDGTEASGNWRTITGRNIYEFRHQFESLDLGGVEIRHPWIRIATLRHRLGLEGDGPALILGMDILSHFHIYIAYKEHNLYLTTIQGDLAAGRKPPEGQSPSNRQARWNARNLVETAWNAEAAGQPTEAASALDQAVALTPDDPEALLARARFRLGRNDIAGATADQDHALAVAPQSPQSHEIRGLILANAGRTDDGIAELSRSVELTPGNSGPLMVRAQIYLSTGQFDLALADCTAALADSPGSSKILETRGLVNLKAARPDAAITDYDAALEGNPKSARALYGRSLAKRAKGDTSGADADLAAARAIRPDIERAFGS
jgi:tetratricopeptide (TPR) repeat protein